MGRYDQFIIKKSSGGSAGKYSDFIIKKGAAKKLSSEDIIDTAVKKGYDEPTPKVGTLTRLGNVLSAFEPGGEFTTLARTGDPSKAIKQYGIEVLRGLGSGIPVFDKYTKPKELAENREGFADLLKVLGVPEGEIKIGDTRLGSLRGAAGLAGDIFIDPGIFLLAPMFKGLTKGSAKIAGKGAEALSKTSKGEKILSGVSKGTELIKEAFVPAYKASKVSPGAVELTKTLKRTQRLGDEEMATATKALIDKYGIDTIRKVPYEIEAWGQATKQGDNVPVLSDAAQDVMRLIKDVTGGEVPMGLRKTDIDAYFPRIVKKTSPIGPGSATGKISTKLGRGGYNPTKGRVYSTLGEAQEAGVEYIEPEVALTQRLMYSQRAQKAKGALNQMVVGAVKGSDGESILKHIGKEEGLLPDHVAVLVDKNGIRVGDKTIAFYPDVTEAGKKIVGVTTRKATYQMHKDVADYMVGVQKVFGDDMATNDMAKIYDYIQNLWKGSVTSVFPAFHVRNTISNIFNNFVAGVKDPRRYFEAIDIMKGKGVLKQSLKKYFPEASTYEDVRKILAGSGVRGAGQFATEVSEDMLRLMGRSRVGGPFSTMMRGGKKVGTFVEDQARIAHYLDKVGKGLSPDDAVKSVNKFLFDYSDLSKFEAEKMKRIFPFYTWTRKNIPLQIEQIQKQPVKYKAVMDIIRSFGKDDLTEEEKKYIPDYLREKFGILIGRTEKGDPQILSGLDLPLEDIAKVGDPLKTIVDLATPIMKTPVEFATGQSFYYKKPIKDTSAYNSTTKAIGQMPILKQFLKAKERTDERGREYYQVDPKRMYLLKALFGRFMSSGEKLTDEKTTTLSKALNVFVGGKVYAPDIEYEKEKQFLEMLRELGITKTFSKEYVPANIKEELGLPTKKKK